MTSGESTTEVPEHSRFGRTMSPAAIFRRFWVATTVSGAGSAITMVALPLVALTVLDASVFEVTLLNAAGQAGWLVLGLPAGVIVQRYPLRGLQVVMDVVRLAAIGSIPLAWWLGGLTYTHLLLAALLVGFANVLFDIGNATFLPAIVEKKELNARNSLMSGTHAVTQTGGPSAGAVLVQVMGPVGALVLDAVSYLVSAIALRTLPERTAPQKSQVSPGRLIREGWNFVVRHHVMGPTLVWAMATNFFCSAILALTPVYLVRAADTPAALVGVVLAMDGLGAVIGSALATRLARALGTARALIVASTVGSLTALLIPLTTSSGTIFYFMIGNAGLSAGVVVGSILTRTYRQTESPPELLSRVMATTRFVSWGALPLGAAVSGLVADAAGLSPALWLVCAGTLTAPLVLLLSPLRSRRDLG
ncbi:Predicted arabinose efflux permease, MFS family [Lentzea fradiae]|uniref:Predicted arabinose efflux permease, MFS family n=1 Tax=Lentzea fradiae TaxID=200378 RepID=A0A1G7XIW3_9PSEU|nr:MFS transporter [Lentzea fradiae]SDG83540.1 Predicted arabinose efflux permease, MFS family [Lentzea fradiae]